jgi:ribosomal-protein-alanine N-acetyltransferase
MVRKEQIDLNIDDMQLSDLPDVVSIEHNSFSTPWSERFFYNEIYNPRSILKVARIKRRIAGYICSQQIVDEGHILDLAVHPEFRNIGVATELISHVIGWFRDSNCKNVFLEVRASNEEAQKTYDRFGFKVLGIRKKYYVKPDEDAVIMSLNLLP